MSRSHAIFARCVVVLLVMVGLAGVSTKVATAQNGPGAVYVLTNQTANSVMVYARAADGTLSPSGTFFTGGMGSGSGPDPLGSQGALVLDEWQRLLFAVNAGSNEVSVFAVQGLGLRLLDKVPSGGQKPVSITVRGGLVYALNAGGTPNIQGFTLEPFSGRLVPLPGSVRPLAGGAGSAPAQVALSPDGQVLMVTEKNTNQIDTWSVNDDGYAMKRVTTASHGGVPFGFTFIGRDIAIVSEAMPSALSSYDVDDDGQLELVTGTETDGQKANCWVVVTRNGRYAYTSNTASGNISSYLVSRGGDLALLDATAGVTGAGTAPIDMALSNGSQFLYVRDGVKGMVDGFRVESDGSLTPVGSAGGVPAGAQGLAAR